MTSAFETALSERTAAMTDACTQCGKCVEVCPVTDAAGVTAEPRAVIAGILDILRGGSGIEAARRWASGCVLTGDCITACDYGVNPRFLLAMTRTAMAKAEARPQEQRRRGIENYRKVVREVSYLSRLQRDEEVLARLGQSAKAAAPAARPDFIFYTGCNVLKTPHIALLCLDVMDQIGISYQVMGGPTHCCGIVQLRTGDTETSGRMAESTIDKLAQSNTGRVISWCPSCQTQFSENTLPTIERMRGSRPFEMTPFLHFLHENLGRLRPHLRTRVPLRVALHGHPGVPGVLTAAREVLSAVPDLELVDLEQPEVGLQSNSLQALPALRKSLQRQELDAAREADVDALVTLYHSDHRELCAHERDSPFLIVNVMEILALGLGLRRDDDYKRLKLMQDADAILADCGDLMATHGLDAGIARQVVVGMLQEQPLPLRGA
ncbi:MAG: (Fe-S)-binding protein [Variibacter sp.]|nr:(Fe-S)-binding protein [Variibacter sp.]